MRTMSTTTVISLGYRYAIRRLSETLKQKARRVCVSNLDHSKALCHLHLFYWRKMSGKEVETNLDVGILNNTEWVHRWAVGNTNFHQSKHDPILDKRNEEIFEGKSKSIFLPLCGKTPDMLWMYGNGHSVCGVELAEQPIKDLFEENNIEVDIQPIDTVGNQYKSKDGRLCLYAADLFDMSPELCGQFDVIYDSRSFVAINEADHQQYRNLMLSLMKPDGSYYMSTIEYDPAVWPGPPHSISEKLVRDLFDTKCDVEMIEEAERTGLNPNVARCEPVPEGETPKELSSAGAAIKASSYIYDRWLKITYKS